MLKTSRWRFHQTKRFKPAKIQVKCMPTLGKTTNISFPLKLSSPNAAKSSICDDTSNNITSSYCQISDINDNSHEKDDIDVVKKTAYQQQQEKQYYSWESIRLSLLNGLTEEEAFFPEQECCECGFGEATIRCLDCGFDQYFGDDCANKNHEKKSYFHLLEMLKVNISIQIVFNKNNIEIKYWIGIASHWWLSQQTRNDETPSDKEKSINYI